MKIINITHSETIIEKNQAKWSGTFQEYFCSKPITICLDVDVEDDSGESKTISLNAQTSDNLELYNRNTVVFNSSIDCNNIELSDENWEQLEVFAQVVYNEYDYDNDAFSSLYGLAKDAYDKECDEAGYQVSDPDDIKIENNLEVFEISTGNWSATFSGIDGSDNPCFEEVAENIMADNEKDATHKSNEAWGLF